jgi:hypothetical protein
LVVVVVLLLVLIPHQQFGGWDLRVNLWGPAYHLVQGKSPYRTTSLSSIDPLFAQVNPVWLPPVIGVFFPIGWLDAYLASDLWLLGNALLVLFLVGRMRGREPVSRSTFMLIPLYLVLFLPLLTHLVLGQLSLLAVLLLLVGTRLLTERRYIWAGLAVVLVLSKPQLAVLALPGMWAAALRGGGKRAGYLFPVAVLLGTAVTTIPLWIGYPAWVPDCVRVILENPDWFQPTLYTVIGQAWGKGWMILPALLSFALFVLNLWLWWRDPPEEVLPWSLALTTIASPYIWTWDFVLLLPLMLRCWYRQRSWTARAIWGAGLSLCFGLMTWIRMGLLETGDRRHHVYAWVPWLILGLALITQRVQGRIRDTKRSVKR